jgi:hypothetical protein
MSLKDRHRSITVRGLACATEWDGEGNPCRVSIFTFDDDEYEVEPLAAGTYLLDHAGQEVMVRGHLAPGFRRRKVVLVKSFTIFGPETAETIDPTSDLPSTGSSLCRAIE